MVYLVSYEFPPLFGGEGTYTHELLEHLITEGIDVNLITTGQKLNDTLKEIEKKTIRIKINNNLGLKLYSFCKGARKKLCQINKDKNIDIIHYTNDYLGLFPPNNLGVPFLATIHHPYAVEKKICGLEARSYGAQSYVDYILKRRTFLLEWLERRLCTSAHGIMTVSDFTASSIMNDYNINDKRIFTIPNGIDADKFRILNVNGEYKKKLKIPDEPFVLFVGRLDYGKGLVYLFKAFKMVLDKIPRLKLLIVGDGVLRETLVNLGKELAIDEDVIFLGKVPEDDLIAIYNCSEVLVLPSLLEGFGIVLLEAMAAAKPCVATRVGGIPEVIADKETGILVSPGDPSALCDAIIKLLSDNNQRVKLGQNARKRVENTFTWDTIIKQVIDVYDQYSQQ